MCFFELQGSLRSYVHSLDSRSERNLWLHFWLLGAWGGVPVTTFNFSSMAADFCRHIFFG